MEKDRLVWTEENRKKVFDCRIFSVWESYCKSPVKGGFHAQDNKNNEPHVFSLIETKNWAIVIPEAETPEGKKFLMVRQWRHGSMCLSLEFPGGVFEPGENPEQAAARELYEETGYRPCKITKLGEFSPNPAIMTNTVYFFLAQDLKGDGIQKLDTDEYVETEFVSADEVMQGMGSAPYVHALMGSALSLYYRFTTNKKLA
ncbi:MAG: NUDIX hydrolase [Treponema sp.]|nr:NUDIX hydrolase [Treponema sp.]